jgi:predicted regulator of amino acid metabolism with ACT domain
MRHVIKKQIIELHLSKNADAFNIQHVISRYYWKELLPALEKVFDSYADDNTMMSIDSLELDLGRLSEEDLKEGKWNDILPQKITEDVKKIFEAVIRNKTAIRRTKAANALHQWLYYMEHGHLHWSMTQPDSGWYTDVLEMLAVDYNSIENLRRLIKKSRGVARRIASQHGEDFLQQLTGILTAEKHEKLQDLLNELEQSLSHLKNKSTEKDSAIQNTQMGSPAREKLWATVLQIVADEKIKSNELANRLALEYFDNHTIRLLTEKSAPAFEQLTPVLKKIREEKIHTGKGLGSEQGISKGKEQIISSSTEKPFDEEGIFVVSAGMILLHPFLNSFLKKLGLVENNEFITSHAQQKTLYLLHYLATGRSEAEEYELTVAKILCAYPMEEPVEKNILLEEKDFIEAEALLGAVIRYWEKLKNTSVKGLQEGFLQRNGKLYTKKGEPHLQVESNAIDILLDYLPWNIGIIKLPWMKEILRVEWR